MGDDGCVLVMVGVDLIDIDEQVDDFFVWGAVLFFFLFCLHFSFLFGSS